MAATVPELKRPERGFSWVVEQSTTAALAVLGLGAASLAVIILGSTAVLTSFGFIPVDNVIEGFQSSAMKAVLWFGVVLGIVAVAGGWGGFKSMPTKVAREEAIAGAVLGMLAVALGAFLVWFSGGEVDRFVFNYMRFEGTSPLIPHFFNGAKNTLVLAFSSEVLGIVLGLLLAVLALSKRAVVRAPARAYINFFRGTPLVWQISFIGVALPIGFGLDIGPYQAGIAALGLNAAAYSAEVFRAGIQSIERGQMEAARSLGMSYFQAMRYAIIPQGIRRVIPPLMNEFVILVKDTALILLLGLTSSQRDLMTVGSQAAANTFNYTFFLMTAAGYLVITLPLIRLVNSLEKRLRSGLVGIGA
ncbi:MAG TPA: amino acid ABC transporter permease [Actinomycetota bacterium]|nr:amino acid ABC transporter permease [Actinomycetota bacterium]